MINKRGEIKMTNKIQMKLTEILQNPRKYLSVRTLNNLLAQETSYKNQLDKMSTGVQGWIDSPIFYDMALGGNLIYGDQRNYLITNYNKLVDVQAKCTALIQTLGLEKDVKLDIYQSSALDYVQEHKFPPQGEISIARNEAMNSVALNKATIFRG
jgi:hypothetical protein